MRAAQLPVDSRSGTGLPETAPAIAVEGLVKRYGNKTAVDGISFQVGRGEIFALLGPNGAGKTTTVEILEGYRKPDGGTSRVLGLDPVAGSLLKTRIGVMLQEPGLYLTISPREALQLFAHFYPRTQETDLLLDRVGLSDAAGTQYRRLSGGQKRRLALALALIGCPEVVFLDEPTAGLDPQARRAAWEIIADLRRQGVTVLLTTHYMDEVERLADRVGILDRGRLVALDTPARLVAGDRTSVRLRTSAPVDVKMLQALPSALLARADDAGYVIETADAPALLADVTAELRDRQVPIVELRVGETSLEEVFLRLTGREPVE